MFIPIAKLYKNFVISSFIQKIIYLHFNIKSFNIINMENSKSNRRSFIKASSLGTLGLLTVPTILTGCTRNDRLNATASVQDVKGLVFASPESQGVPSGAILEMLDFLEEKRVCMHSFILMRHGAVVAEGYWPPFHKDRQQRMYSVSKSFTSVAIGLMITEGKLKLDDKVADFFPEELPQNPHPFILQATVRDLLLMSTFNARSTGIRPGQTSVWAFFNTGEPLRPPGAIFSYDTAGTNTLAAIIEKQTGMSFIEYMRPKILDPIGISRDIYCIKNPDGRSWSGSGVLCTTRDLARFALLCMNRGAYEGNQLVSKEYMQAATSRQIENAVGRSESAMRYGYGYQFWCLSDGGFAGYGMGGQFMFCMPKHDVILCTTADVQLDDDGLGDIQDAYMNLLKRLGNKMADDTAAQKKLSTRLESLAIQLPEGNLNSTAAAQYNDKVFKMEANPMGLSNVRLSFKANEAVFNYVNETGAFSIRIGLGHYILQSFPEPYSGKVAGVLDKYYDTIAGGGWVDENVFKCTVKAVDTYLGTLRMQFVFRDDMLCVQMAKVAENFFDRYQGFAWGNQQIE